MIKPTTSLILLIITSLLFIPNCYALTRYVNTASTPNGDGTTNATTGDHRAYATLNEAIVDEAAVLSEPIEFICEGTAADTAAVTITGYTTSAENYILIRTTQANRHNGKWNTGRYRLDISGTGEALDIRENYTRIEGLQVSWSLNSSNFGHGIHWSGTGSGTEIHISHCIVKGDNTGSGKSNYGILLDDTGGTFKIWNNVIYNSDGVNWKGIHTNGSPTSNDVYIYNVTVYSTTNDDTPWGFGASSTAGGNIVVKNCLCYLSNSNGLCFRGVHANASEYNASSDGTAPGDNSRTNQTVTFVDEANDDFRLSKNDTAAKNQGTSSVSPINFTDDIQGNTRPWPAGGSWDIGASEALYTVVRGAVIRGAVIR